MLDILSFEFMRNAFWSALLASLACGLIGPLVVINRKVFLAGGIAHSAYGGVGLAILLSLPVLPVVWGFTLLISIIFAVINLYYQEMSEVLVGLIWSGGMAFGILLLDLVPGYNVNVMSYLFGSILTVSHQDLIMMLFLDLFIAGVIWWKYKDFITLSFDFEYAKSLGLRVNFLYILLISLISFVVVLLIEVVGLILVVALLTIPVYLARRWSNNLCTMMILSFIFSLTFSWTGIILSFYFNLSSGASIIGVAVIWFSICLIKDLINIQKLHY
ncbi:MAG: iron chelate uptake ABC transporter family permease subunit [Desulfonauticus sp.]|nr:iron chelate uptake ABC transporter family permease subunit [Desulfonauticus sp.]